jgi:hypothetical protein
MPKERYVEGVGGAAGTDATGGALTFGDAIVPGARDGPAVGKRHRIRAWARLRIIGWSGQGSMLPRDEVERTMRRFADQVMPKLASG